MSGSPEALRRVRAVLRGRRERPSGGDVAYGVYLAIMLALVVPAPLVRAAVLWLVDELPVPGDPLLPLAAAGFAVVALVALPVAGGYAGPLRISLPEIDLLLTTGLPRPRLLGGRVARAFGFAAIGGAAVAALLLAARALRGELHPQAAFALLGVGAVSGLCCVALLFVGQLSRGTGWQALRDQALRLDVVGALALTGDLRSAAGRLGAPVRSGRGWRWIAPKRIAPLLVSRDLLGIARTPLRSLAALLGAAAAGTLLGAASTVQPPALAAISGASALLLAYASIGPWCRGLRTAGETVGSPPLLPLSPAGLLLRHLIVPGALATLAIAGAAAAVSPLASAPLGALLGASLAALALALRLLGALKGPLPQRLLAPVTTPVGDMAGINVLLWNLDGPVWAVLIGGVLAAVGAVSPGWAILVAAVSLLLILAGGAVRLRALVA